MGAVLVSYMDAVAQGRVQAESRMSETVQIGPVTDGVDMETGDPTWVLGVVRYSGPARVKYPGTAVSTRDSVQVVSVQDIQVSIPWDAPAVYEGDGVVVTASSVDPALVGKKYTVKGAPAAGQTTARRVPVTELS